MHASFAHIGFIRRGGAVLRLSGTASGAWAAAAPQADAQAPAMTPELFFDYLGVRLNAGCAQGKELHLRIVLTDARAGENAQWDLNLARSVLHARKAENVRAPVTLTAPKLAVMAVFAGKISVEDAASQGLISGEAQILRELLGLLDTFSPNFPLVLL